MTPGQKTETPILDSLSSVKDIRSLSYDNLSALSKELRYDLMHRVNQVGGHFASSLGVTELTVALHYSFDTPQDRIVWDVGHQAYIHKILTGRREKMLGVRKLGGISGFPRRTESDYDTFGVAHAGTSISAALGMKIANLSHKSKEDNRHCVAVIGDGAMTAGMAFEALNHAGQLHKNLIVILNDNEMSIAPNVGALSWAFSKAVTNHYSTVARKQFKSLTEKGMIPKTFYKVIDKAEEATQGFLSTPGMLFSAFGFRYIGPIDGHDIPEVVSSLNRAKEQDGPVLIHMLTTKGKGYDPAEDDPVKYHAISANQIWNEPEIKEIISKKTTSKASPVPISYTNVFAQTMLELCQKDSSLVGITAAMPDGTGLKLLAKEMPERFYDVGIAEQHAVTFAAGLACEGIHPVCAIYSTFLQRAYDQVIHDVCIQNLPVIFAMDRGGLVGSDGPTHHGVFDISYLRSLPNMVSMAPRDESEFRDMLFTASQYHSGPISIRYPRGTGSGISLSENMTKLEIGKGEIFSTSNSARVALVGLGNMFSNCMLASQILENEYKIPCTVVNPRFIKPIDSEMFSKLAQEHEIILTIEDGILMGGFGSAILETLSDKNLMTQTKVIRLGIPDSFIEHGSQKELYDMLGLNVEGIVNKIIDSISLNEAVQYNHAVNQGLQ